MSASAWALQVEGEPAPNLDGQWAGPWDLTDTMDKSLDTQVMDDPTIWEIAHAAVLPPDSPANAEASSYGGKVLFINDRFTYDHALYPPADPIWNKDQPTFVWDPGTPSAVAEHVMVGNACHEDLFCSGHAFLGNGNLITSGGLERALGGGLGVTPVGIGQSYVLRTDLQGSPAGQLLWEMVPTLSHQRWYPTVVPLQDGTIFTSGHAGYPQLGNVTHQTFDVTTPGTWSPNVYNYPVGVCSGPSPALDVRDYPRLHLLMAGYILFMDNETRSPPDPVPYHVSSFLPQFGPPDCTDPENHNPYQWRDGVPSDDTVLGEHVAAAQGGGNSVHLITRPDTQQDFAQEAIYAIGGVAHGIDDQPCPCVEDGVFASNRVFRMENPFPTTPWEGAGFGTAPKDMNFSRVNANAVVLLDGSILMVGGTDRDPNAVGECNDSCLYRKVPELYKPPEVFEGLAQTSWNTMAPQIGRRRYHSVAGLLPDGRVFSAGGTAPGDQKTVELYTPPYFFRGPRPSIVTVFDTAQALGQQVIIRVSLRGGGSQAAVKRVALIRNAAVTHAFDMNQRYVEVEIVGSPSPVPGTTDVDVFVKWPTASTNPFEAPPGWYMLTVVADMDNAAVLPNANNLPSRAKWIKLESL